LTKLQDVASDLANDWCYPDPQLRDFGRFWMVASGPFALVSEGVRVRDDHQLGIGGVEDE
jgi:hypothetical protein